MSTIKYEDLQVTDLVLESTGWNVCVEMPSGRIGRLVFSTKEWEVLLGYVEGDLLELMKQQLNAWDDL